MATRQQAGGAGPSMAAMTKFSQCLSLERPESYSCIGRANDTAVHVTKFPRPMLYSPAAGLVVYEPVGFGGVAQMEWLEKLSSPKVVCAKSPNASRAPVQQHWRPPSPGSTTRQQQLQQQQERELSLRGGQARHHSMSGRRTMSPQQPSSPAAAVHTLQDEQHWGSSMLQAQLHAAPHHRRPHVAGTGSTAAGLRGSAPAWDLAASTCSCTGVGGKGLLSFTGDSSGSGAAAVSDAGIEHQAHGTSKRNISSMQTQQTAGQSAGSGCQQAPQVVSHRLTLTQPYVFRWGGRITSKHRTFCEMRNSSDPEATSWKVPAARPAGTVHDCVDSAIQQQQHMVLDSQTAAAAAELGARADKLMKLLELRVPRQSKSGTRRPVSGRMQHLQQQEANISYDDELVYELENEPISMPQGYLRL